MKVITIGRGGQNDIDITDSKASRHHMQIIQHDDGHFTLSDFGSTNGTFVNGQKISGEIPLNDMDIVRIGNTTIPWRMYFEDGLDTPIESIDSPAEDVEQFVIDNNNASQSENNKSVWRILTTKQKIFVILLIISIPCNVVGAIMLIYAIWEKAKIDNQPVETPQPNGESPSSLLTICGIGHTFWGAYKFRKIGNTYVGYTMFQFLIFFFPTGCYRVENVGYREWKFHGSEKKKTSEIRCLYLTFYGLLISIVSILFLFFMFML